jgi:hypothetical protein
MASTNGSGKALLMPGLPMLPHRGRSLCTLADTLTDGGGEAGNGLHARGRHHPVIDASVAPSPVRSTRPVSGA